ncbi:uncharacterized protein LOC115361416 [Myripristis murdjan]|nr:uncharacterized protein LOC115361416 [Myripristis murdjan]
MPRAKSHRRAQAQKRRMAQPQPWTPQPPVPEFVARRGTGYRHRVRRWPTSELTQRSFKLVTPALQPDQKMVFVVGDSHLRAMVDGIVAMPEVFVLDFPPRLNIEPGLQDVFRQEFRRVHLSDSDGTPILVQALWDAAVRQLAPPPPPPPPSVPPRTSPRARVSPVLVVTGHSPAARHRNPLEWTVVGQEGKIRASPVQESVLPSNPVWFSGDILEAMERVSPSSDSDVTALLPAGQVEATAQESSSVVPGVVVVREEVAAACPAVPEVPARPSPARVTVSASAPRPAVQQVEATAQESASAVPGVVAGQEEVDAACPAVPEERQIDKAKAVFVPSVCLELDGQLFRFGFGDTVLGEVGVTEGEYIDFGVFISLRNGLERIFSQYTTCLLTMCGNTTAIVREGGRFAVVDSHSRSSTGLLHHNGTSVVLHFACLDDLHHYICRLADSLLSREKLFELCGVTVSTDASPARSGVSVESLITEMSAAPAPESSVLTEAGRKSEVSAGVCVPECGVSIAASPALSGISVLTFSSEVSSGSAAEPTVANGRKRVISSGTCMSKKSKSFDVREVNSDVEFVSEVRSEELVFHPLGLDVCRALCTKLNVDCVKVVSPVATEEGLLGVPCSKERIVADGNCFFRAISQAVSGSQKHHRKIRLAVCKELERNTDRYQSFLRSEYSSVLEYIEQSRMRRVGSWATEVEIQATADWLGVSVFTFHDGRWIKYSCSSQHLSAECVYLENVMGRHFENVVCVFKPGLQSCFGYCKISEVTGYSIRPRMMDVVDGDNTAVRYDVVGSVVGVQDSVKDVEAARELVSVRKSLSKYLKRKQRTQEKCNMPLREKRQLTIRKMYKENVLFRENAKFCSVEKYCKNLPHRERVKQMSISKYRESIEHRERVKARSVGKYRDSSEHRERLKARSVGKYRDSSEHRERLKARSVGKYRDSSEHRERLKARSVGKYRDSSEHRERLKARSFVQYRDNSEHRERVKGKILGKYRDSTEYREKLKKMSKSKYHGSVDHKQRVISSVRLGRKQKVDKSKDFGFVREQFLEKVRDGPDFVCCVCHRLFFRYQVVSCDRETYRRSSATAAVADRCIGQQYLHRCSGECVAPCSLVSSRGNLWICYTCDRKLSSGEMPAECWVNNLELDPIPAELGSLNSLEQHLIALHIPFMKMLALPKGGQNGVHGPVTCVPANIVQTANVLPRSSMEGSLLQVKLKRKLTYKGHYEYQFVDTLHVRQALDYLKRTNVYYRDIEFNEHWVNEFVREEDREREEAESGSEGEAEVRSGQVTVQSEMCELAESADIGQDELLHDRQQHCMFQDTCLMPVDIGQEALDQYFKDILNIAPAEGNSPVRMLSDHTNEAKCFPVLFPTGGKTYHDGRWHDLTLARYLNNRIMHADGRFARNVEYIFFAQYVSELDKVVSSVSVALRKGKGGQRPQRISEDVLADADALKQLLACDDGFRFLKPIRGTPAFWQSVQKDVMACVRQLGIPTWFCSFSSADMRWQNLLTSILKQEGRSQTVEDLEWADRCALLRRNPVTAARMFDYRWHCFLKEVLMSPCHPIGKIIDYFYRVEFQQRGSPHVHCLFWIEGAPQIDKNTDEEVIEFIDRYVTCELPSDDDTLLDTVSSVQTHSKRHSKSCRKHKTTCRFNFPKPVTARTFICRMRECKCDKNKKTGEAESNSENKPACKCFEDRDRMPKEFAHKILEDVKKAVERDVPPASVEDLFRSLRINQEIFERAYRRLEKKHKVVYRRGVNEVWVNQYSKKLLKCWNANMDISFVTDAYAVVIYIISYITKAEREIGLLLTNAQKEAKKQGNLSAKEALRKLGSVYLHNRDVCAQEAVYRLTNMHLRECSRKVVFVPTGSRIVRMSLPLSVLRQMAASRDLREEDMWMVSIVDRYRNRPDSVVFDNMCMATFASEYRVLSKNEMSQDRIELKNDLGFILRRTRTQFAVVRYMRFNLDREEEAHFQSLLQLFLPYRTDSDLKPEGFELFEQFYNDGEVMFSDGSVHSVHDVVDENRARFEVNCPHLELAQEIAAQNNGVDEDVWGELCPEQEAERLEGLEEMRQQREGDLAEEQLVESLVNVPDLIVGGRQVAQLERNRSILSRTEGLALVRSLNETQLAVFYRVRHWCLQKVMGKNPEPLRVFVTGGAGTGKSHLIRAIQYEAARLLSTLCDQPDDICVLLTAPTGIAAYNLNAATIHHTLSIGKQASLPYTPLGEDKLNSLRAKLSHLQILIIDEISMVNHNLLAYVHGRLRQIKQTGDFSPFGNVSVIAVGDFYQLPPVKGKPLYSSPVGVDLWCNFSIVELKKIVRQKDSVFAEMLNRLRVRSRATPMLDSDVEMLKMRETGEVSSALHIFATNRQVSEHNLNYLFDCCPDYVTIEAQDFVTNRTTGNLERMPGHHGVAADTSLPETLCIARNARVMLCKNVDVADGLVNGACGTVTQVVFGEDSTFPLTVYVRFDDEKIGSDRRKNRAHAAVECLQSTAIDPEEDRATKRGGLRRQFPLRLAWACTVHKVQGLTVDEAVVSLKRVFAPGQAYVALSRVRALSGLIIEDFTEKAIYCKDAIKEALDSMPPFLIEQPEPSLNAHSFSVYLMNVQNLSRHMLDLVSCTQHLQLTCIAVTETWLTAQSSLDSVQIEGYTFHSRPRGLCYSSNNPKLLELKNLEHGGVGLYSVDNLDCDILQVPDLNLECLVCLCNKFNILLAVIYRPPCYPITLFKQNLGKLLDWLHPISNTIVIMGDFNENILKTSSICKFMGEKGFSQHVTQETTEKGTLIDHVYVKTTQYNVECAVMPTYFSDHEGVACSFSVNDDQGLVVDLEEVEGLFESDVDFDEG